MCRLQRLHLPGQPLELLPDQLVETQQEVQSLARKLHVTRTIWSLFSMQLPGAACSFMIVVMTMTPI